MTIEGRIKEIANRISNLTDSITTTESVAVRRMLEERLSSLLVERTESEAEAKQLS